MAGRLANLKRTHSRQHQDFESGIKKLRRGLADNSRGLWVLPSIKMTVLFLS
jgi:hypothetical protein